MNLTCRSSSVILAVVVMLSLAGFGCPPRIAPEAGKVITVLSGAEDISKTLPLIFESKQGPVAIADIDAFYVTLTGITMMREGSGTVAVYSGDPVVINLVELMGVSSVLSSSEVEAGTYNQIRLHIADPVLYLVDDPLVPITDIHLTANDRLMITGQFEVPQEQISLLELEFTSMHLVELGHGGFTLTPQLRADISITDAAVQFTGTIIAIDEVSEMISVALAEGDIDIYYADADIYLSFEAYNLMDVDGSALDLALNAEIWVEGLLQVDGTVLAESIVLAE